MSTNGTDNPGTAAPSSVAPRSSNPPSSADAPSSPPASTPQPASSSPPPASSSPPPVSSSPPPPSSSAAPPSSTPQPQSSTPVVTSTAPTPTPSETIVITSYVTPPATREGETPLPSIVLVTVTGDPATQSRPANTASTSANPSSTDATELQGARKNDSGGLSTGGKTAIAVVIPVVVVALLLIGALFFWRKRKQRKNNEDERRKEVEEYGFNPNHDPTLPAVGVAPVMAEDSSGYRGWGNTATSSGRKASTTLTSGMTYSDSNSNPGGYASPHSPTNAAYSDANSNDPLVNGRRETLDADGIAALGAAPTAAANVHRGPSNASSSYSAANHSDNSGDYAANNPNEYYEPGYGGYNEGPYGVGAGGGQPVIRDVSARRNTRIENPNMGAFPQGNSGVATNF